MMNIKSKASKALVIFTISAILMQIFLFDSFAAVLLPNGPLKINVPASFAQNVDGYYHVDLSTVNNARLQGEYTGESAVSSWSWTVSNSAVAGIRADAGIAYVGFRNDGVTAVELTATLENGETLTEAVYFAGERSFAPSQWESLGESLSGGYARTDGLDCYYVDIGAISNAELLTAIEENTSVQLSRTEDHTDIQVLTWSNLNVSAVWDRQPDTSVSGVYTMEVSCYSEVIGVVTVTVADTQGITSASIGGSVSFFVERGKTPDCSAGTVSAVTEDGGAISSALSYSMLNPAEFSLEASGSYRNIDVVFEGFVLRDAVTVTVTDVIGEDYPEYPQQGAVVVDKFAHGVSFNDTGAALVELSVQGVPVNKNIDIVLIMDISMSMTWKVGEYTDTTTELTDPERKINAAKTAAKTFSDIVLADNPDGSLTSNTISIVSFASVDKQQNTVDVTYDDVRTEVVMGRDSQTVDAAIDAIAIANTGSTCYDYAFQEAIPVVDTIIDYNTENNLTDRETIVIFMTDGAPTNYNGVYYKNSTATDAPRSMQYTDPDTNVTATYLKTGFDRNGLDVDTTKNDGSFTADGTSYSSLTYNSAWSDYILGNENQYWRKIMDKNITMITIGFDLQYGNALQDSGSSMPNIGNTGGTYYILPDTLSLLLESMASTTDNFYSVHTSSELTRLYVDLAAKLTHAEAKNAYVIDFMGEAYDLLTQTQMQKSDNTLITYSDYGITPCIEFLSYDTYTMDEVDGVTVTADMYGTRKRDANGNFISSTIERVTFNSDGTQAYSDLAGEGVNVLSGGEIKGETFSYNTITELFTWNIGDIKTNDLAARYYVYLTGSLQGQTPESVYATNKSATLYYENYLGNSSEKTFPVPSLAWGKAQVSYALYLVNSFGEPVSRSGRVVPFDYRVNIAFPQVYDIVELNSYHTVSVAQLISDGLIAEGYSPYDASASFEIYPSSNLTGSNWSVTLGDGLNPTTYVSNFSGSEVSKELTATDDDYDYTNTTVWFGVLWEAKIMPDTVVVDFGLPVKIDVLANDLAKGTLSGIAPAAEMPASGNAQQHDEAYNMSLSGTYGFAEASENFGTVVFTPADMNFTGAEELSYEVRYTYTDALGAENTTYLYAKLTVIPATIIYYEDNFISFSGAWTQLGTTDSDAFQDTDRPGRGSVNDDANNIYGYDSTYSSYESYSLGSAMSVSVSAADSDNWPSAEFSFTGTGFDLVSVTNNTTGTIFVNVRDENDGMRSVGSYVVDTYYGYVYSDGTWSVDPLAADTLWNVPVIKISGLEYSKYSVTVSVRYSAFFDHVPGSTDYIYIFDAVRIYDPAGINGSGSALAYNAYAADGESSPEFEELRNMLISAENFNSGSESIDGVVFIDGLESLGSDNMLSYKNFGPNNEVYLAYGQSLAFAVYADVVPEEIHFSAKLASGSSVKVCVGNTQSETSRSYRTISTVTDMYYNVGIYAVWSPETVNGGNITQYPLFITNTTPGSVLSITNVKCTFKNPEPVLMALYFEPQALNGVYSATKSALNFSAALPGENIRPDDAGTNDIEPTEAVPGPYDSMIADIAELIKTIIEILRLLSEIIEYISASVFTTVMTSA